MKYIALLRGINVGGQKSIRMPDLVKVFESLGFKDVRTYVQSGNVIFEYDSVTSMITSKIEMKLNQTYGFNVNVIIRTKDELEKIISNNPFLKKPQIEIDKLHVTFLSDLPDKQTASDLDIKKEANEQFIIIGKEVYLYCPNGYGKTKLNNQIFEKKLKTIATTRNWRTTNKLLELSKLVKT